MLLNQCLAISLSPVAASSLAVAAAVGRSRGRLDDNKSAIARLRADSHATESQEEPDFKLEALEIRDDDHTPSAIVDNGACSSERAGSLRSISWHQREQQSQQEKKNHHQESFKLKHSSASLLFTQLLEQNCPPFLFDSNKAKQASSQQRPCRRDSSGGSSSSSYGYLKRASSLGRPSTVSSSLEQHCRELSEALRRVEFAGFVMPSWLLVSGSYDDLHCIKSSWADGKLKSPDGFKIETLGNIRSINVDYFGSTANELDNKEFAQVRSANDNNEQNRSNNSLSSRAKRIEKSVKQQPQQARLSRLPYRFSLDQRGLRDRLPKLGSLNAAIVESVRELRSTQKQQRATSLQPLATAPFAVVAGGIHVRDLLEHLSSKYASQLLDLPATEFIDCAISGLVRSSKLCLRPATRASSERERRRGKLRETLVAAQHNNETTSITTETADDDNSLNSNRFDAVQSAFLDQLILLGDEEEDDDNNNNNNDRVASAADAVDVDSYCDEQSLLGAELLMSQHHQQRRVSRLSLSASTTKSKSTTLDSGIQSWDLVSSPTATELETSNNSNSSNNSSPSSLGAIEVKNRRRQPQSHDLSLLFRKQQRQHGAAAVADKEGCRRREIIMMAATTVGSLHHRADGQVAAQSAVVCRKAAAAAVGLSGQVDTKHSDQPEASEHKRTRRGFSLSRSFSFRPKKSASVMNENDNKEKENFQQHQDDRWSAAAAKEAKRLAHSNLLAGADQPARRRPLPQESDNLADTNCDLYASRGRISNLSSLFRSKSMRIISSGKAQRQQQSTRSCAKHQRQALFNSQGRFDSEDYENFAPNINVYEMQDANGSHVNQWTSQQHSGNHSQHHQQATIDYLATAQPHKRSLSTRRLTFNAKEEDLSSGGGGGKIVLFLRKLFNLRKKRLLAAEHATTTADSDDHSTLHLMGTHNNSNSSYDNHHDNYSQSQLDAAGGRGERGLATGNVGASGMARDLRTRNSRLGPKHALSASSSSSSSGSNSLIEILDCSRAVDGTKRLLREENALSLKRATWRLVRRSDSSLSRSSRASCETIKSTVSQQLRRHLDEAYRRHRNCTSQREKEFIDSINVLRQASRHALQNSRSSSKVRQAKSVKSGSNNGSASDDNASSVGSTCTSANCSSTANEKNITDNGSVTITTDNKQLCANCSCNRRLYASQQSIGGDLSGHHRVDGLRQEPSGAGYNGQAIAQDFDLIMRREQQAATALENANVHHQQWLAPTPSSCAHSSLANCCICTSYLTSARLFPTLAGCCPAPPPNAVGVPACCLAGHHGQQAPDDQQERAMQDAAAIEAFCCPIWRSMVYNYCPPAFPSVAYRAAADTSSLSGGLQKQQQAPGALQLQVPFGSQALENHSTSSSSMHQHQVQQHQHNATIDLKIEIGAELLKQASRKAADSKQESRRFLVEQTSGGGTGGGGAARRPVLVEPPLSDSLDSNDLDDHDYDGDDYDCDYDGHDAGQTKESLEAAVVAFEAVSFNSEAACNANNFEGNNNNNDKEEITIREFELDSCDSDQSKLDSLRTANQVKLA